MASSYNPFSLEGKTILVTGASSGIGKATAIECSRMGARVILVARNIIRLAETTSEMEGKGHLTYSTDLTDKDMVEALIKDIPEIDGVVLCAGIGDRTPVEFSSRKKIDHVAEVNFYATVELTRQLLKNKKIKRNGSIVAIASIGGISDYTIGLGIYGCMKAALSSWMKFVAKEEKSKGIRANCICPGMVMTPAISNGAVTEEQMAKDAKEYIHKRYGRPEEIADAAIYLLSDASLWITGSDLFIDGGKTL